MILRIAYHVSRIMSHLSRNMRYEIRNTRYIIWLGLFLLLCASCAGPALPATPLPTAALPAETPTPVSTPTITPLPSLTPARTPAAAGLYVDAGQDLGAISPLVFGTNYGPWLFVPLQMQPQTKEAGLTLIRYPGGNWGDQNDLDEWSVDQFVAFTRQLGAEPYIHVRLKGGTAQKAAELVKYANVTKKYGVRYWTIGNEPNLFGGGYEVEQFNKEWREWALAMRAVDPTLQLIGPEVNQFFSNPTDDYQRTLTRWVVEFLKVNGDLVDIVSFHRYPFPKSVNAGPPSLDELRASSREWDDLIPAMRALAREHAGRDLPVAVTEVNSSWAASSGGETTMDSHANAIWWGDALGRMIRQGTFIVNQFAIIGEFGLMGNYEVKPIYYVYPMYRHFGQTLLYTASDDPNVSIFAARRADGALTLMLINLGAEAADKTLTLDNTAPADSAETWLFDKSHAAVQVAPTPLDATTTLHLSPESMTLLIIAQS